MTFRYAARLPLALLLLGCPAKKDDKAAPQPPPEAKKQELENITLAAEAVRSAQIETVEARRRALGAGVGATARITTTQQGIAKIAPRVAGRLVAIKAQLGQPVKANAVLGMLESPELGSLRASYMSAATKARVTLSNYKREKELLEKGITSEREMREAESVHAAAKAELDAADSRLHALGLSEPEIQALKADEHFSARFPVRSPIDGNVVEITGTVGESVESTAHLFTVADLSRLWVLLDVYEAQLAQVKLGQPVDLAVTAFPGRRFRGKVDNVGDVVDEKSRAVKVRVVVPNPERLLKPGMFVKADISTEAGYDGGTGHLMIVVPREAVQRVGTRDLVFVQVGPTEFKPVPVKVGDQSPQEVEIVSGIEEGAKVVSQGAFVLKSELSKESMGEGE